MTLLNTDRLYWFGEGWWFFPLMCNSADVSFVTLLLHLKEERRQRENLLQPKNANKMLKNENKRKKLIYPNFKDVILQL